MRALVVLLAAFLLVLSLKADDPVYSADGLVNAFDNQTHTLAANTVATLYGTNLAYGTRMFSPSDMQGSLLPVFLAGTQVRIGPWWATLFYASPTQITFLVPPIVSGGPTTLTLTTDGHPGPDIAIQLADASPALFLPDMVHALAIHADGSLVVPSSPAKPGEQVTLYATGLGETSPSTDYGTLPTQAARLSPAAAFSVLLDGAAVDSGAILFAGSVKGYAGLYRIVFNIPPSTGPNPEIRVGVGDALSTPGISLTVQP